MRVLWVVKELGLGGAEHLLLELLPHAQDVDFVPVSVASAPLDLAPAYRAAGLSLRVLGARVQLDPRWMLQLRRAARLVRPDLVHLHLPYTGVGGRLGLYRLGIPIVYTEHNVWDVYRSATRWANAATFGMNDAVLAVSDRVRTSILSSTLGRRVRGRLRVVPNGIDADRVRLDAAREPGVELPPGAYGTVTTLTARKGPDVLAAAAALLADEFPDRRCVMAGGGEMAEALRRQIDRSGAPVTLLGPRLDARSILGRLEVVVIASRNEGLPLVLLEAMALGRPVVATAVGGIPEVVRPGVSGLLVPPEDPVALAQAVGRVLRDPNLGAALGAGARQAVEANWHARGTASLLVRTYSDVLSGTLGR